MAAGRKLKSKVRSVGRGEGEIQFILILANNSSISRRYRPSARKAAAAYNADLLPFGQTLSKDTSNMGDGSSGKARPSKSAGLRVPAFNDARKLANSLSATVSSWMTSARSRKRHVPIFAPPRRSKQGAAHPKTKYSAPFRFNTPSHTHHELSAANRVSARQVCHGSCYAMWGRSRASAPNRLSFRRRSGKSRRCTSVHVAGSRLQF